MAINIREKLSQIKHGANVAATRVKAVAVKVNATINKPLTPEQIAHRKRLKEAYEEKRREGEIQNARRRAEIDTAAEISGYRGKQQGGMFSGWGTTNPAGDFMSGGGRSDWGGVFGSDNDNRGRKKQARQESNPFGGLMFSESPRRGRSRGRKEPNPFKELM